MLPYHDTRAGHPLEGQMSIRSGRASSDCLLPFFILCALGAAYPVNGIAQPVVQDSVADAASGVRMVQAARSTPSGRAQGTILARFVCSPTSSKVMYSPILERISIRILLTLDL